MNGPHRVAMHGPVGTSLVLIGLWVCTSCGASPPSTVVRVGADVDAENLDPRLQRNTTGYRVVDLLYDGLVHLDTTLQPQPDLAESWERVTPTTWDFHLHPNARFHDGTPVTSDDVVYTFDSIRDPAFRAPQRMLYEPIERVEALDEHTVRVTLRHPYAPFLSYMDMGIVPRHVADTSDLGMHPVGSGPYRLQRWDKGNRIVLAADSNHWSGVPAVPEIQFIIVPDNTARAQAMEAGGLDLIQSPLAPQDVKRLVRDARFVHRLQYGVALTYLNFNTARPILRDPRMRRALAMLVDQETIIDQIYERTDTIATSILAPGSWAYSSAIHQPTYDPEGAVSLLHTIGWSDSDGDGILDRGGQRLTVSLGTHSEDVNRVQTVEFLQNSFTAHGVQTEVWISDWPSFSSRRDAGDYDIILLGWTQLVDPDRAMFEQLHSSGGLNWGRYRNARLDSLLDRGRFLQDRAHRTVVYREAASIIAKEVPYYILSHQQYQVFTVPAITDFQVDPRGLLCSLANVTLRR
jgi:peptide/nickel transport system substrate-binding protein